MPIAGGTPGPWDCTFDRAAKVTWDLFPDTTSSFPNYCSLKGSASITMDGQVLNFTLP